MMNSKIALVILTCLSLPFIAVAASDVYYFLSNDLQVSNDSIPSAYAAQVQQEVRVLEICPKHALGDLRIETLQ